MSLKLTVGLNVSVDVSLFGPVTDWRPISPIDCCDHHPATTPPKKCFILTIYDQPTGNRRFHIIGGFLSLNPKKTQICMDRKSKGVRVMALLSLQPITVTNYGHLWACVCRGKPTALSSESVQLLCNETWAVVLKDFVIGAVFLRGSTVYALALILPCW